MSPRRLGELTTEEAAAVLGPDAVLLLPVGSTEAHGPHLPLETDVLIAEETARRTVSQLEADENGAIAALLLPSLAYSRAECARHFAGTISLSADTARGLLRDLCRSLAPATGPLLCLVNAHLEPEHLGILKEVTAEMVAEGCRILFPDPTRRRHLDRLGEEFRRGGGHAGGYETSLVLAAGGRVDETVRSGLPPNPMDLHEQIRTGKTDFRDMGGPRAYFGDPAGATTREGERLYDVLTDILVTAIRECRNPR